MIEPERLLPHSIEAEQGLLCSLLISPSTACGLCSQRRLGAQHFFIPANAIIYDVIMDAWQTGRPVDYITLTQRLSDKGELGRVGGPGYVTEVFTKIPTAAKAPEYVEILETKRKLRSTLETCYEIYQRCFIEQDYADELVEELAARVAGIATETRAGTKTMKELLHEKVARMQATDMDCDLLPTGLMKLDRESPLRRGAMPLIAGERKSGKSILAMTIGANIASAGHPVIYFTLEDPASEQLDRLVANLSRVPVYRHHEHRLVNRDAEFVTASVSKILAMNFIIRDDAHDIGSIVAAARHQKAKFPNLGAIIVDYAQLVRAKTRKQDTRESEVATVSRALRLLAIELKTAVIVLSQLNKDGDTRESKSLEQDATAMWKVTLTDEPKKRVLSIPFQRNGESGVCFPLTFLGEIARYENFAEDR